MGRDAPDRLSLRSLTNRILLSAGLILGGIGVAVAVGAANVSMLPAAVCGAGIACGNFFLIRKILEKAFAASGVPTWTNRVGSMGTTFFQKGPVTDYASAKRSDTKRYAAWFHGMLSRGVYIAPSQFEAGFVSLAHTKRDLDRTIAAARATLSTL